MGIRVLQVVAGLNPNDGGPSHTLPQIWNRLGQHDLDVHVLTTTAQGESLRHLTGDHYDCEAVERSWPYQWKYARTFVERLEYRLNEVDLCHNHGCWLYPNYAAGIYSLRRKIPYIISPLGHLDAWSLHNHRWRKWWWRNLFEQKIWKSASAFIAKSNSEADSIRLLGIRSRIEIIPNGVDISEWDQQGDHHFEDRYPAIRGRRILLFLSRLDQKKGVEFLLDCWKELVSSHSDWCLVIAGDVSTFYGQAMVRKVQDEKNLCDCVVFTGELRGNARKWAYRQSQCFVLPSRSENFGQVVLEAQSAGVPVMISDACPWRDVQKQMSGWCLPLRREIWIRSLCDMIKLSDEERHAMGERGRDWVRKDFDWARQIEKMIELYQSI